MSFQVWEYFPGVFHIKDALGVCMTLMTGTDSALLFDTGFGLEDLHDYIRSLTPLPLRVVLSHAHHDHALGSRFFDSVFLLEKERETFLEYTQEKWRRRVLREAGNAGILVDEEEYLAAQTAPVKILREGDLQLGGLTARVIACPGHTPGSAVLYVPERELLLTGDNWNPCTWLFFPEACGAHEYRRNVSRLLDLPFRYVLCPHNERVIPREELEAFLRQLTDEVLEHAPDDPAGKEMGIHTGGKKELYSLQYLLKMKLATTQASANAAKATADAMRTLGQTTPVTIRCAITVIATVPILLVYPFLQQYFVTGIALGSVKE